MSLFFKLIVGFAGLAVVALFLVYWNVLRPIRRISEWVKNVRLKGHLTPLSPKEEGLLKPVTQEISAMAKSLAIARLAAEEEARLRHASESVWTPERLREFVKSKLGSHPLFVVSDREPYRHVYNKGKQITVVVPASGLVTAIEPVLNACGGTWIAQGDGSADHESVDAQDRLRVPPEEPQYLLRRVWVTPGEREGYYLGFSNEGLWPLCHIAHTRPIFRELDWACYQVVNGKFAKVVLEELEGTEAPCVLIQDYHFALLPALVKLRRPDARVAIFWHIPWPNPESFGICPWQKELLQGMLAADVVGFHTQYHCNHFIQTVDHVLESRIDYEHFTVNRHGHTTQVKALPISIDFFGGGQFVLGNKYEPIDRQAFFEHYGIDTKFVGVGVDRLDYTKGILERFRGVEIFLKKNPEYQGQFTFFNLSVPSRLEIPRYQELASAVRKEADRINQSFQESFRQKKWKPIVLLEKHHSHEEILPFYRFADVCLVTSLHDGMNLVAKEFVAARDDERGVLVLSQFTGASRELKDALLVNPYDLGQMAEAVKRALEMPLSEQQQRMRNMRSILRDYNVYRWAADLIQTVSDVRLNSEVESQPVVS